MKKILSALLALLLLTSMVACGAPTSTTQSPTSTHTETATTSIVTFADPALEAIVRGAMGKSSGDITVAEAKAVTSLSLAFAEWQKYVSEKEPISSISGLENFTSLENLDLSGNAITDLAPLSALTDLKALILTGCPGRRLYAACQFNKPACLDSGSFHNRRPYAAFGALQP